MKSINSLFNLTNDWSLNQYQPGMTGYFWAPRPWAMLLRREGMLFPIWKAQYNYEEGTINLETLDEWQALLEDINP